jgi:LemA protein
MFALIIILIIVAILIIWGISINNGIVRMDNRCDNAWQTIDAQLQRRNDLIPNLVETVKGYAKHESATFEAVTKARSAVASASTPEAKMTASNGLTAALKSLFAVAEAYPTLKANTNFQQLQTDLTDTENKISYARQSYNDCVLEYNNAIETFPGSLIAGSRFKERQGFEVTEASAREAPKVKF